jgi:hypothetical protein
VLEPQLNSSAAVEAGMIPAMARRMLAWVLVTPVAAAGILCAHALAYRLTGTETGSVHAYLDHAPQVLAVLATIGLVGLAVQEPSLGRTPVWPFALLGPLGFACQEHVERLAHTGELPFLLTTPSFALGLVMQLPVVLVCIVVARRVAGTLAGVRRARPPVLGDAWLPLPRIAEARPRRVSRPRATGRAPPPVLAS